MMVMIEMESLWHPDETLCAFVVGLSVKVFSPIENKPVVLVCVMKEILRGSCSNANECADPTRLLCRRLGSGKTHRFLVSS